jgi:hypothetical protein
MSSSFSCNLTCRTTHSYVHTYIHVHTFAFPNMVSTPAVLMPASFSCDLTWRTTHTYIHTCTHLCLSKHGLYPCCVDAFLIFMWFDMAHYSACMFVNPHHVPFSSLNVCMYTCVCVCVCVCNPHHVPFSSLNVCVCVCLHACMYIYIYVCVCVCGVDVCVCIDINIHAYIHGAQLIMHITWHIHVYTPSSTKLGYPISQNSHTHTCLHTVFDKTGASFAYAYCHSHNNWGSVSGFSTVFR